MISKRKRKENMIFTLYHTGLGEIIIERLKYILYYDSEMKQWIYRSEESYFYDPYDNGKKSKVKQNKFNYGERGSISENNFIMFELDKISQEFKKIVKVFSEYDERIKNRKK